SRPTATATWRSSALMRSTIANVSSWSMPALRGLRCSVRRGSDAVLTKEVAGSSMLELLPILRPRRSRGCRTGPRPWASPMHFVTLLALAAFFSGAALRICDGLIPRLAADFGISTGQAGSVVITFSIAYGLMQLVFGPFADRFGKA